MKIASKKRERGIALIIVMIVIVLLATLAGGFAYSMKVETRLARNSSFDSDMENLGRSGVERARWILAEQMRVPIQGAYTALNQKWADGAGSTNEPLINVDMNFYELPPGWFALRITDMERKFNLSAIRDERFSPVLQRALEMVGVDSIQVQDIVESYLDWVDPDDMKRINGAESDFYMTLNPSAPYIAKNGLMDDPSELLLIRGMTPDVYFGGERASMMPRFGSAPKPTTLSGAPAAGVGGGAGLIDLFTTISSAGIAVNANTASADVLQIIPGMDSALAQAIIDARAGPDGTDGTEDDTPFERPGDLYNSNVPGMTPELQQVLGSYLVLNSSIFQVIVEAHIGGYVRRYEALLQRRNAQDVTILYFRVL